MRCLTNFQFVFIRDYDFKYLIRRTAAFTVSEIIGVNRGAAGIGAGEQCQIKGIGAVFTRQEFDGPGIRAVRATPAIAPDVQIVTAGGVQSGYSNWGTCAGHECAACTRACASPRSEADWAVFHQKTARATLANKCQVGGGW